MVSPMSIATSKFPFLVCPTPEESDSLSSRRAVWHGGVRGKLKAQRPIEGGLTMFTLYAKRPPREDAPARSRPQYHLMENCWQEDMGSRPSFKDLTLSLERMLEDGVEYLDLSPRVVHNRAYFMSLDCECKENGFFKDSVDVLQPSNDDVAFVGHNHGLQDVEHSLQDANIKQQFPDQLKLLDHTRRSDSTADHAGYQNEEPQKRPTAVTSNAYLSPSRPHPYMSMAGPKTPKDGVDLESGFMFSPGSPSKMTMPL
ncbi:unnamed protein product [Timema podura]|uniref:Uncharacterized protein n=1 Tax=Timema podura TaxID=61482 RepID=A0ABN7PBE6_TIMPD|nr:unnamed protein product [Timema podura]